MKESPDSMYIDGMNPHPRELSASLEDYLEAVFNLERKYKVARVKQIAKTLNVQMPSVTNALKVLKGLGLINYENYSFISLTDQGRKTAEGIQRKHSLIASFLQDVLLLPPQTVQELACRMEHLMSTPTAERFRNVSDYLKKEGFGRLGMDVSDWDAVVTGRKPQGS